MKEDLSKYYAMFWLGMVSVLLLLTCSCASSRNADMQKQVDYSGQMEYLRKSLDSLSLQVARQAKTTTDKLSNMELSNTTVYYSRPDSAGRQYPVKESTTSLNKEDRERQQTDETLFVSLRCLSERMDSLDAKLDILLDEKGKVTELSWWDLHKDAVCLSIIATIIVGWMVYKKRKRQ